MKTSRSQHMKLLVDYFNTLYPETTHEIVSYKGTNKKLIVADDMILEFGQTVYSKKMKIGSVIEKATMIAVFDKTNRVYMFFDPRCLTKYKRVTVRKGMFSSITVDNVILSGFGLISEVPEALLKEVINGSN